MPIPPFTIDGVVPPFVGPHGPGGASQDMTPYSVSALEVALTLGSSERRREILRGWLGYRGQLRAAGVTHGFQWLDGSFVEDKDPNDLDVVTFFRRPPNAQSDHEIGAWVAANMHLFDRARIKAQFSLDAFPVDLNGDPESLVGNSRYWLGLFSHRRGDNLWKGMLQVRLEDAADDAAALAAINPSVPPAAAGAVP
jgi:hypothetical protein